MDLMADFIPPVKGKVSVVTGLVVVQRYCTVMGSSLATGWLNWCRMLTYALTFEASPMQHSAVSIVFCFFHTNITTMIKHARHLNKRNYQQK